MLWINKHCTTLCLRGDASGGRAALAWVIPDALHRLDGDRAPLIAHLGGSLDHAVDRILRALHATGSSAGCTGPLICAISAPHDSPSSPRTPRAVTTFQPPHVLAQSRQLPFAPLTTHHPLNVHASRSKTRCCHTEPWDKMTGHAAGSRHRESRQAAASGFGSPAHWGAQNTHARRQGRAHLQLAGKGRCVKGRHLGWLRRPKRVEEVEHLQ